MFKYFDQIPSKEQKNFYIPSEEFPFENKINSPLRGNNSGEYFFENEKTDSSTSENTEIENQLLNQRKFYFIIEKNLKNSKRADYISKKIFKIYKDYELELIKKLCEKYKIKEMKLPFNRFFINHYKCILTITLNFILGFLIAISGIILITLNGVFELKLNPLGDILALLAMISWGIYCVFLKKIQDLGYSGTATTRHIMEYGFIFLIPLFFITKSEFNFHAFTDYKVVFAILFLALFASTIAFLFWNYSCERISAVSTNIYLYLSPLISTLFSFLFLNERITIFTIIGMILSVIGLIVSSDFIKKKLDKSKENASS